MYVLISKYVLKSQVRLKTRIYGMHCERTCCQSRTSIDQTWDLWTQKTADGLSL